MKILFYFSLLLMLFGCAKDGDQYIGKWVNTKYGSRTMDIERNGESYIIHMTSPSVWNGKPKTENIPATLEAGLLKVNMGMVSFNISLQQSSGLLTDGKLEYKKVDGESDSTNQQVNDKNEPPKGLPATATKGSPARF
jgi:hypothetical protein